MEKMTKGMWKVQAGVIPGQPLAEFTRTWEYTSEDYENDQQVPPDQETKIDQIVQEATEYAGALMNPRYFNWVTSEFVWV